MYNHDSREGRWPIFLFALVVPQLAPDCHMEEFGLRLAVGRVEAAGWRVFARTGPLYRKKNLSIPAAAGFSPSMPLLVFWPLLAPQRRQCFSTLRSAVVV